MPRVCRDTDRKRVGRAPTRRVLGGIVAVNRDGRVFASDTGNNLLQRFDHT